MPHFFGQFPTCRGHEPLSLRILWRYPKALHLCSCISDKIPKRISDPLLDRIDIHIEVPHLNYEKHTTDCLGKTSEIIRKRVLAARAIKRTRYSKIDSKYSIFCNADMCVGETRQFCKLRDESQSLMRAAMVQLNLSARAYHRILKRARTIADLAGSEDIQSVHLAEALHAAQPSEVDARIIQANRKWSHFFE